MPPRKAPQAKKAAKASTKATKASAPTFTPAQAKELQKLLKVQKEAEAAKEEAEKQATRKRSAAMLQEERASSEEERSSPAPSRPVSRARKFPRILSPPPNQRKVLNSVTDVLNHNASEDEEGGEVDAGPDVEQDVDAVLGSGDEGEKDGEGEEEEEVDACGKKKKKSVMEDQEVEVEESESNYSQETRTSTGKGKAKVNLSEFSTPRVRRIAQLGSGDMRRLGALEEAFPSVTYKEDKCWEVLTRACKPHSHLNSRLKELDGDSATKDMLIAYAWQGLGCMRAELMTKARQGAPSWFGLTDLELGEDVVSSCQWLLQENHFLYGGIDLKERTYDRTKPWMNRALVNLIADQFWTMKGDAVRMGKTNNKYLSFPDPLLAACASGFQCTLKGFSVNGKFKGSGSVVAFTDENFRQECASYVSLLGNFKTQTPSFYKLMKMDMLDALIKMCSEAASMVTQSTSTMAVDMNALEESAKQLLAERGLVDEE